MKYILFALFVVSCNHAEMYDVVKVKCPNGKMVSVKVKAGALESSDKQLIGNKIKAACGIK